MATITVGASGANFTTIQAAIDAAGAGDTIRIAAGTYSGDYTLNKSLIIEGANKGIDGAGARAAETILTGTWSITTSDKVKIDGVEFLDDKAMPTLTISDNFQSVRILTTSAAGHEITNSVFFRAPSSLPGGFSSTTFAGSNSQPTHRGIEISNVAAGTSVSVTHNLFTGNNPYSYAGDSWRSAVYSNGGDGTTNITDNTFTNVRTGVNADSFKSSVHIDNNKFDHSGTGVTFGVGSDLANVTTVNNNKFGAGVDGEFSLRNVTTAASFDVAGKGNALTATGASETFSVEGTFTSPFAFKGTAANDLFTGNAVGDTATVAGTLTTASFTTSGNTWKVATAAQGTDTLVGVEKVTDGSGANFLLVGAGSSYTTIQAAINAASAGDTIIVAAGTYNEKLIVNKAGLKIIGQGDVNIQGTFRADNGIAAGTKISTWLETAASYSGASGALVRVEANNVVLTNLNVNDSLIGVAVNGQIQNLTLNQVDVLGAVFGFEKPMQADYPFTGAVKSSIDGLTINQGSIKDAYLGMDIPKVNAANNDATNVTITGTAFQDITHKGIYAETLSNATITGITMNHVAYYGNGPAFGSVAPGAGQSADGIDLNLKYGAYSNITITGFTFTDVGTSGGPTTNVNAAAIVVKVRGDATDTSYSANPATWTGGPLIISNGSIDGTYSGIKLGESGKQSTGPNVASTNVTITNALDAGVVNYGVGSFSGSAITTNNHTFSSLNLGPNNKVLLVDATHYTTIQAAIDAAIAGDVVAIAAGTYAENLSVTKGITLANQGAAGSVIVHPTTGNVLNVTGNLGGRDVSIQGLDLQGVQGTANSTTGMGVFVAETANVGKLQILNSTIRDNGGNGIWVDGETTGNAVASIEVTGTNFSHNGYNGLNGASHIKLYGFKGAATITDVNITGGSGGVAQGNVPNLPDYGIELHGTPNPALSAPVMGSIKLTNVNVSGDFHKSGLAINNFSSIAGLQTNAVNLSGVQTNWTPVFIVDGVTSSYDASTFGLVLPNRAHVTEIQGDVVSQPASGQTIVGTAGNDWLMGKGGNDWLKGGAGSDYLYGSDKPGGAAEGETSNDMLEGGAGDDFLFGGGGTDTAIFGGAHWMYSFTVLPTGEITVKAGSGLEGMDTVKDVELFQFADRVYTAAEVTTPTAPPVDTTPFYPPTESQGPNQPGNGNNPGTGTGGTGGTGGGPTNPSSGQNPGGAQQTNTAGTSMTGVDPTSTKGTSPTITLPNGQVVPNESYQDAQLLAQYGQQYEAGTITKAQLIDKIADLSLDTTSVALTTFQFFTGSTPSKDGLAYLVNSPANATDLTDPYYAQFSDSNLYINFAVDQGLRGVGATFFLNTYGNLSFEEAARKAYAAIIGNANAAAAGINIDQAIAGIMAQQKYFTDVSGGTLQGAKAAMVGYLMYEGMKAHIGTYYNATHAWYENAFNGAVGSQINLLGSTPSAMIHELV